MRNKLNKKQINVLLNKATEAPFSGVLNDNKNNGTYICAYCNAQLFNSNHKFDSGSGWPSFYDVIDKAAVELVEDLTHGMVRTEVICRNCKGHLGHVFDDGPKDKTGKRYCINSASLNFIPADGGEKITGA